MLALPRVFQPRQTDYDPNWSPLTEASFKGTFSSASPLRLSNFIPLPAAWGQPHST